MKTWKQDGLELLIILVCLCAFLAGFMSGRSERQFELRRDIQRAQQVDPDHPENPLNH